MSRFLPSHALRRRVLTLSYHPVVTKLSVSMVALGLLMLIVVDRQGREALVGLHLVLSREFIWSILLLAALFLVSTLSPFFPEFMITVASGFVFGVVDGSIFATVAITLAASANFVIARRHGRHVLQLIFDLHSVRELRWIAGRIDPLMVFLTWLLPSINFDLISYAAGLSAMRYPVFLALTIVGTVLSSVILSFLGASLRSDQAITVVATLMIYTIAGLVLYVKELPPLFEDFPALEGDGRRLT
jgi:uncharacterized membrane protein YdjX (TVP38/TMEM64 family)